MQIERRLQYVLMLNLCVFIGILLRECVTRAEVEVTNGYLVVSELAVNHFTLVEDLKLEESALCEVSGPPLESNVEGGRGVVRSNEDLFLEDDPILPGSVLIAIFKGLYLLNLLKVEVRAV